MISKRILIMLLGIVILAILLWILHPWFADGKLKKIYATIFGLSIVYIIGNIVAYIAVSKRYKECRMRTIEAQELYKKMQERRDIDVINVLPEEQFHNCHIAASSNIPFESLQSAASQWDKNKEIIVYCASRECRASRRAYDLLCSLGFTNVYAYEGGIREWKEMGLPTEGVCNVVK